MEVNARSILASIFCLTFLALVIKFLNWVWFNPKKLDKMLRKQGLSGTPYRLVIGDLRDIITAAKQEQTRPIQFSDDLPSHVLHYYHQIQSKYGKTSFFWFGPKPSLNISEPELIKEILTKTDLYQKIRPNPIGETVIGGLLMLEDEKWSKHRKIVNPTFHMEKLKNMVPAISLVCTNMTDKWDALVPRNDGNRSMEIDVWPYLENLSGDVISRTAFGSSYEEGKRVFHLQNEQLKLVLEILPFTLIPLWRHIPTKANRRLLVLHDEIRTLLKTIIDRRKRAMERGEEIQSDLLSTLMESNGKETDGMSTEEVIEECRLFYFAGSETTSVLILWTLVMLCKHREWQDRARDEVVQVFGKEQPTFDGLNRLKIVNMILLEVLRMYPPAPLISRSTAKTVKLGNVTLPKGVHLMLLIAELHHDPEIWGDDANEFRPERFSGGVSSAVRNPFSYVPFSAGPRVCIGQNMAMIEAKVALAVILRRFSFELGPSYVHAPFAIVTLRPQHGATLLLHKL